VATEQAPGRRAGAAPAVLAAAAVSGIAGYVVLVLVARYLTPAANAEFLVFWGALFGVFGVLIGIATETTRAVHSAPEVGVGPGARVLPEVALLAACVAVVLGLSGLVWAPAVLGPEWPRLLAALVVGTVLFASHCFVAGTAAGRGDWTTYALLVGSEAASRLVLVVAAALAGALVGGLAWAVSLACGAWVLVSLLPAARTSGVLAVTGDVSRAGLRRRLVAACTASGASALLLVGFPVLLRLTTSDVVFAGAAPLILAVSLSRAPLLVPLNAYQNVLVTRVASHGIGAMRSTAGLLAGATVVGAVAAVPLGPAVLRVINPEYDVAGPVFGLLVLAAGLVGSLTLTGAASIALDHHTVYVLGYVVATSVATLLLLLPLSLETRVVVALLVGPLAGIGIHLAYGAHRSVASQRRITEGTP
jgi:O-antigen/teichoic acid export membrane protein